MKTKIATKRFSLFSTRGRWFVRCHVPHCAPRGRRVSAADARYLARLSRNAHATTVEQRPPITEFDMACVADFGVGIFQS